MILLNKISEYLFYLLVFLLPLQTRLFLRAGELNGSYFEYRSISLYSSDILLLVIFILFCISFDFSKFSGRVSRIWYLLAGLEFFILVSCFVALDKSVAFYGYIRFLSGFLLFFLMLKLQYSRTKISFVFLGSVLLQSLLAIWQFLVQGVWSSKWLGMSVQSADFYSSVIEASDGGRWLRAYGSFSHPNMLGGFLVFGILYIFILFLEDRGLNKKKRIFLLFTLCLASAALFFSFSRAAWLALATGLLILLLLAILKKEKISLRKISASSFFILFVFLSLVIIYRPLVAARMQGETRLENRSTKERMTLLSTSRKIIKENFFLGVGMGNYTIYTAEKIEKNQPAYFYQPVHNVFLLIWSEIGVFGLIFFILAFLYPYITTIFRGSSFKIKNLSYSLSFLLSLSIMFMLDHWWWSLHFGVLFLWFLIGLELKKSLQDGIIVIEK